jgi:aerotaxis receptor
VVRTTTTDADRRRKPRFQVDEPCIVTFGDLVEQAAKVVNLSTCGATLVLTAELNGESAGILRLDRHAVRIPFTVRSADGDAVRIKFDEADPAMPALHAVVERLTAALQPLDAAA